MNKKFESIEKQVSREETKVPFTHSHAMIKSSAFDRKTPLQVHKIQFTIVAEDKRAVVIKLLILQFH